MRIQLDDEISALVRQPASAHDPVVLFIHPANLQATVWLPVLAELPASWGYAAIDLPGHGSSRRWDAYSVPSWAGSCLRLLDHLEWRRAHLVGASVGAPIAASIAAVSAGRIRSLTTVGGACAPATADDTREFLATLASSGVDETLRRVIDEEPAIGDFAELVSPSENSFEQAAAIWRAAATAQAMAFASRVLCPVLAIVGALDSACPPEGSREFARATGGRLEMLEGLGHLPMISAPPLVASLLAQHIMSNDARPPKGTMMTDTPNKTRTAPQADIDQILHLHREWWQSNLDWDIPRMQKVFPNPGDEYLMFNFNGHPYFGMKEKVELWRYYEHLGSQSDIETKIMRLEIVGDMAWLACETTFTSTMADGSEWTADNVDAPAARATEIYHRDDGDGNREWRMWHTQITALPDLDEERPGLGGSTHSRGLGWVPWNSLPEGI